MISFSDDSKNILISGGIGVIPTDTIYGIVGRAELPHTVERIYAVRKRDEYKPCIILISSPDDLNKFNIVIPAEAKIFLDKHAPWPWKVSIVFPCLESRFEYLTRGTKSLAFRVPDVPELRDLLLKTGPLIAPSANIAGRPSATVIQEARQYFGNLVDFYIDGGKCNGLSSTLITFTDGKLVVLRQGAVHIHSD